MDERNKNKRKLKKVKVVLVQCRRRLRKHLMWIKDMVDEKEVEVEEVNLKLFALDVE